jgi:hypothetical protein
MDTTLAAIDNAAGLVLDRRNILGADMAVGMAATPAARR